MYGLFYNNNNYNDTASTDFKKVTLQISKVQVAGLEFVILGSHPLVICPICDQC